MPNTTEYWFKKLDSSEDKILPSNFKSLKKHLRKLEAGDVRERTIVNHIQALLPFSKWCQIDFKDLTEDLIFDYSEYLGKLTFTQGGEPKKYKPSTLYFHKTCVKSFLKDLNPTAVGALTLKRTQRELPEILNEQDIEALIKAALHHRDKAMISTLFESGCRKGEMLSIRLKNVEFDENGAIVILPQSKTKSRRIRLIYSASYLREWIECHPAGDNRESILFCSLRSPYNAISETGLHDQLRKIASRAGIKKPCNPHAFRHAAASRLALHLTEQELKVYLGWTMGSSQPQTYVHLSGKDIDSSILRMHGIVTEDPKNQGLKVMKCYRCRELVPVNSSFCSKCGMPLSETVEKQLEAEEVDIEGDLLEVLATDPQLSAKLLEMLKKLK
jgi:integrase/recombinase XerD